MSTLLVYLPWPKAGSPVEYDYVLSHDANTVAQHGRTSASLLPSSDEVVLVLPAGALSWHAVQLPKSADRALSGPGSTKLRAILQGLLEERLLDELEALHLALAPRTLADGSVTVAACERASLRAAVHDLEQAQRPPARIVPELAPHGTSPEQDRLVVVPTPAQPQLAWVRAQEVLLLPLSASAVQWVQSGLGGREPALSAEPAVAGLAESFFKRPAELLQGPQRALHALRNGWDLAQFDLQSSGQTRALKRLRLFWQALRTEPVWRPLRWGLVGLLAVNVAGLNAWAWQERQGLQAKRQQMESVLTSTFPGVRVVVDAPRQMQRELAALQHASGGLGQTDLETLLAAAAPSLPAQGFASGLDYVSGQLHLKGLSPNAEEANKRLQALGLRSDVQGGEWVLSAGERP